MVAKYFYSHTTIRHGNTFLLMTYPTVYQYNVAEEEFRPMANMTQRAYGGAAPILVDLNNFPACMEEVPSNRQLTHEMKSESEG